MKKDKSKSKSHETNIGKIIYGFLLFMPLIAIGVTCITTWWNKTIDMPNQIVNEIPPYETNEVNSIDDLIVGKIYNFTIESHYNGQTISYFDASKLYNINNNTSKINIDTSSTENNYLRFQEVGNYYNVMTNTKNFFICDYGAKNQLNGTTFQFIYLGNFNNDYISQVSKATWIPTGTYEIINNESTDLNVFYYSIDKVQESNLFNWAQNSIVYTTLTATCSALSINNTFIPLLLAYWLIISVIYILYDIALVMLMIFHRKVHELQECI